MANVIDEIAKRPKPLDIADWWQKQAPSQWTGALVQDEQDYLDFFTSDQVPKPFRIGRGIADGAHLDAEEKKDALAKFGDSKDVAVRYANFENRRRIIAHYVWTHPTTIQYEMGLYRLSRDLNPVTFVLERVHQLTTGSETFTNDNVSRIEAGAELLIPIVISRVLRGVVASAVAVGETRGATRALTDPIYDLPPEGGGMMINGRWYSEHALERMAPDTPQIRAELRTRAAKRLERLGLKGTAAYDACLSKALKKIDPRGIPPSVVEAEISKPGSTQIGVITAKGGRIVVTVKYKK
jgi:hypothetical protein